MSIKSIKIKNLLSFDELIIDSFEDINCIVGKNNVGKSNLLKLIRYFYEKLENKRVLPPTLHSNYSSFGTITIVYDISRIKSIVTYKGNIGKSAFFKYVYNVLFVNDKNHNNIFALVEQPDHSTYELTLQIHSNDSTQWMVQDKNVLKIINYLFPFFDIETRHIDLYDWNKLWLIVSRLKSFNVNKIDQNEIINFFDERISNKSNGYREYIATIEEITTTGKYNYREKLLNYVKTGLKGQTFLIDEKSLETQSDGTNSHGFIKIALELLISLSRRDYISPTIYIDEPENGLHPKKNEELLSTLSDIYLKYKKTKKEKEKKRYKTPYPKIIFATHSPNIVKEVIKLFPNNHQILHFSKIKNIDKTIVKKMHSSYSDSRFINVFSDNEARLFFSNFILFVEGESELEIFGNKKLLEKFPVLKQIDIYKSSSNVFSDNINPDYSNTSIPYLFLYDADKIYSFEADKKSGNELKIKLKNSNKNLYILPDGKENETIFDKKITNYKRGFNKKYADYLELLREIKQIHNKQFSFNQASFDIQEKDEYASTVNFLKKYLNKFNVFFVHTTIEEILIGQKSKEIFFKWLKLKYSIDVEDFLFEKREIEYTYSRYKMRKCIGITIRLFPREIIKKKIVYKKSRYPTIFEEKLVDYIRVNYFAGKFEILNKKGSKSFTHNRQKNINEYIKMQKSIYKKIKNFTNLTSKQQVQLDHIFNSYIDTSVNSDLISEDLIQAINKFPLANHSKASGWATEFLNFAIDEIENTIDGEEFEVRFKKYFGELYDIISIIRNKL